MFEDFYLDLWRYHGKRRIGKVSDLIRHCGGYNGLSRGWISTKSAMEYDGARGLEEDQPIGLHEFSVLNRES